MDTETSQLARRYEQWRQLRGELFAPQPSIKGASSQKPTSMLRPTHFLALPLQHPALHNAMALCQAAVVSADPQLKPCLVPPEKAHFTFFVFHASSDAQLAAANAALAACAPLAAAAFPTAAPRVTLSGLGSFGERVLYVKAAAPSPDLTRLHRLHAEVAGEFARRGVLGDEPSAVPEWTPHLTLLKQSAAASLGRGRGRGRPPRIRPAAYAGLEGAEMGTHAINELSLCSMAGMGEAGFYRVLSRLALGPAS